MISAPQLVWVGHVRLRLYLKHRPDVLQVRGAGERGLNVAHCLHQGLSRLCHLLHLYVVQQPSLFLTGHACFKQQHRGQFIRTFSLVLLTKLSVLYSVRFRGV